jgi:hypothetical protein
MKMTGVEVPVETLQNVKSHTTLLVFTDKSSGDIKVVQVDSDSIPKDEAFVRVNTSDSGQGGCWVCINSTFVWCDPCPYG